MRSDVKLGFAIGGVLLAVLIVYVLVVPAGSSRQASKNTPGSNEKVTMEPTAQQPTAPPAAPAATFTPPAPAADAPVPAPKTETAVADASKTEASAAGGAAATASKDVDWNKLLNEPPALMSDTPVAAAPPKAAVEPAPPAEQPAPAPPADSVAQGGGVAPVSALSPPRVIAEPAAEPTTQPAREFARTHRIHAGETLSTISAAAYGSPNYYPAIVRANPGIDPNRLKVGMTINLPDPKDVKPTGASEADAQNATARIGATPLTEKQYRVQPNDSLYKISVKLYGTSKMADRIYELNKQSIGADPARLKLGQVLELPEPPTVIANTR